MSTSDYVGPEDRPITKQMIDEGYASAEWTFGKVKAFLDVVRYEEADRLFKQVHELAKRVEKYGPDEPDFEFWHKYEDRPLSHNEVYSRALEDVMDLMDIRMGVLSAG